MTTPSDKVYNEQERRRAYYISNRERIRAAQKKYYDENREKIRATQIDWQRTHLKERVKANRKWRHAHPEQASKMHRDNWLKRRYGITAEEWEMIFEAQGRCCAICNSPTSGKQQWHVDHAHGSKRVRGILCHMCNLLLGSAVDNCDNLRAAIAYLIANQSNSRGAT